MNTLKLVVMTVYLTVVIYVAYQGALAINTFNQNFRPLDGNYETH